MYTQQFVTWLEKGKNLSPATAREYKKDLTYLKLMRIGQGIKTDLAQATYPELENMVFEMREQELKPATINKRIAVMRSFFHYLQKIEVRQDNPASLIDKLKAGQRLPAVADLATVRTYLLTPTMNSYEAQTKALISLITCTGVRISEALAICFEDIIKADKGIKIHGKGNKERVVYYEDAAAYYLNEFCRLSPRRAGKVFTMSYHDAYNAITTHLRKDGRGINPHQLRHMFATLQYERGVELKTVSMMLGHSTVRTTETYTHISPNTVRTAYKNNLILN